MQIMYATYKPINKLYSKSTRTINGRKKDIMMNQNTNNNAQAQATITLTEAVVELTQLLKEAISLAKEEEAASTTATETTATTTTETTATTKNTTEAPTATETTATTATETTPETTTATADEEDNTEFKGSMIEQDPTADISALYDIAEFALMAEGKNIESDRSPYAPKDNRRGLIGDYQVFISKDTGSFRLIIKDKSIVTPIMDFNIHLIDSRAKAFSSENTHRMEKMKEDHDLMRFLNIVEEISSVVMSKYSK